MGLREMQAAKNEGSGSVSILISLLVWFVPIIGHGKIKDQETSETQSASGRKPERAPCR